MVSAESARRHAVIAITLLALLGAGATPAPAATSPGIRCQTRALAAAAAALACEARRSARAERSGAAPDTTRCDVRLARRLDRIDAKLGDACSTGDTTAAVDAEVASVIVSLLALRADAEPRCRASMLLAGAGLARCELRNARRALRDEPRAPCEARFTKRLVRIERRGTPACTATAARADAITLVALRVAALAALAEDATSTSTSTTSITSTTTTTVPDTCGNGSVEVPEECDDGARVDGDGCGSACTLEDASALCTGVPSASGGAIRGVLVTDALTRPVGVASAPLDPGRLFVIEQRGTVRIVEHGVLLEEPFLDVSALVACCQERGLLGLAFHPDYATNGRLFVNFTDTSGDTVIARYAVDPTNPRRADPASRLVLLRVDQPYPNHNGGHLAFGPDGYLYAGMGDGGSAGDPLDRAQSDATLLGKMLRLDVDVDERPYWAVPPSNPRFATGTNPLELIWAKGLRNPWRFSFDRGSGDLWIGDVGQNELEEIDWQPAASPGGENWGWDVFEASACFEPPAPACPSPPVGFSFPVHEYGRTDGCSVTGGAVYRGCALPALHGRYFYSDYCGGWVRSFVLDGGVATGHADHSAALDPPGAVSIGRVTSVGEDARGELYIVDVDDGELFRIEPAS